MEPKLKDKRWRHELEEAMIEKWKKEEWWKFDRNSSKPVVVIDTPPAYPGPFWHFGAAVSYSFQDMVARAYRMMGYNVLYPMCFDNNGIPVEWYVEKYEGINMHNFPREKFVELCSRALDKYVSRMKKIMRRMLISADYEDFYYLTDSKEYRKLTQSTFIELYKKGLIYLDDRPNNWCPRCKTTIADAEVDYKEKEGKLWFLKFKIKETGEDLLISTTRPELLGACGVIIVNPDDDRYKELWNKKAIVPLYNFEVGIIPRREADMEFGTGAVMICSYGDKTDVSLFRELGLEPKKMIDESGKMTEESNYGGMAIKQAREKIVEDLKKNGFLQKEEEHVHKVPIHDKCKTPIEIIPMPEYYLKQKEFKKHILKIAKSMEFHPEKHRQRLIDWINSVSMDWPISRRRYYATEIPLWYCKKCGYTHVPEPGKYYRPWKEKLDIQCPKCGSCEWEGEDRTLDTWMDSSISILFLTKYNRDKDFFKKTFLDGFKIRPQGYEIIRTWLYYSLLRVYQLLKKPAFDRVMVNGMGLDDKGRKMSKSLGNVIYPEEVIAKYGADSIRFWSAIESSFGEDYRGSEERIRGAYKFLTKLWNIARFVSMFPKTEKTELKASDKWILSEMADFKRKCIGWYKKTDFLSIAREAMSFMWDKFASNYIEMVKWRAKQGDESACWTLREVLKNFLLIMAPIIPAITDYIWRQMYDKKGIHKEEFGGFEEYFFEEIIKKSKKLMEFNSKIWKIKKERGIKLKESIKMKIPPEIKEFSIDLKNMHNLV